MDASAETPPTCARCKQTAASLDLRGDRVCPPCFLKFAENKTVKRIEALQRESRGATPAPGAGALPPGTATTPSLPPRYLVALSRGASSTVLLHVLAENLKQQKTRSLRPRFRLLAVHVEAGCCGASDGQQERYQARFPDVDFLTVPLSDALRLDASVIDWDALPPRNADYRDPEAQLRDLLARLPSATSRADVARLLTRHVLLAAAAREACGVVLLGSSTTALAELTLAETAKGRGVSLPWQVNDGPFVLPRALFLPEDEDDDDHHHHNNNSSGPPTTETTVHVYQPLRELFRKELQTYAATTSPPLTDLLVEDDRAARGAAVVSHKDLSIEDVMARYFADVEHSYPSVVANVVRTTGKLSRQPGGGDGGGGGRCGLCGIDRDEAGDERWRGELGELGEPADENGEGQGQVHDAARLCYGCYRSIHG